MGQLFVDRIIRHLQANRLETGLFDPRELIGSVGGDQDFGLRGHVADPRPVAGALDEEQDCIDPGRLGHVDREREKGFELLGQSQRLHALGPGLLAVFNGDMKMPQVGRMAALHDVPSLAAGDLATVLDALLVWLSRSARGSFDETRPPCSHSATYTEYPPYGTASWGARQRQRRWAVRGFSCRRGKVSLLRPPRLAEALIRRIGSRFREVIQKTEISTGFRTAAWSGGYGLVIPREQSLEIGNRRSEVGSPG